MSNNQRLFAFKLADKNIKTEEKNKAVWKARNGVSVAGCTAHRAPQNFAYPGQWGADKGIFC